MIHTLQLSNFRGIEFVSFDELAQVNLIIGGNNTGKTSILEALTLLYGEHEQLVKLPKTFRQSANDQDEWTNFWPTLVREEEYNHFSIRSNSTSTFGKKINKNDPVLFYRKEIDDEQFDIYDEATTSKRPPIIEIRAPLNGRVNAGHSAPDLKLAILSTAQPDPKETSALFNEIAPLNPANEAKLEELLRKAIEPRLKRLRYAKLKGTKEHLIYADVGSGPMIPFTQMGQAFARALHIYCEIFSKQPDILLVDEIENGLYYGGLENFWRGLFVVLKDQNVQLFATTHSRECMEAAQKADASTKSDSALRYLRLDRHIDSPNKIIGTSFGSETMSEAVEFGQEMR